MDQQQVSAWIPSVPSWVHTVPWYDLNCQQLHQRYLQIYNNPAPPPWHVLLNLVQGAYVNKCPGFEAWPGVGISQFESRDCQTCPPHSSPMLWIQRDGIIRAAITV